MELLPWRKGALICGMMNTTDTGRDGVCVAALYRDGLLIGMGTQQLIIPSQRELPFYLPINARAQDADVIKLFLWDSLDNMQPITQSIEYSN